MIIWKENNPDETYGSMTGRDERGNIYHMVVKREIISVITPKGTIEHGWTAAEALERARIAEFETENKQI